MRATVCLISGLVLLLGGCSRTSHIVGQFAENMRTATEQMAFNTEQENQQRERRIDPYISETRNPPALKLVERYETREGPDGLFVYDTEKHSIARIGSQAQTGLTLEQATEAVDALSAADAKGAPH